MHYVPESARELLQEDPASREDAAQRSFHYRSAPIYLLTAVVGLLLGADLLFLSLGTLDEAAWSPYRTLFGYRLALLAAVLGGARILYQTLEALFDGRIGADLALTIAAVAAILLGEHTTAALVVFIALCGESIEGYTLDRAQQAIRRIFNLCPPIAHVNREGREVDVPIDEVTVGETVIVRPGERIPIDGRVTAGTSAVDQSALTGESLPIDKSPGDVVFTGTLNQFGALTVTAERVGGDTTLAQVIRLVAEATQRKAPLERTADRLARLFLPVVLAFAGTTLLFWKWRTGDWSAGYLPALGVLVVACPCPLVLATPTAVMAAMAWLARTGVVVKGSVALERLATVDTFVFDKTGTLTQGEFALGDIHTAGALPPSEILRTAAVAERRSEHLLARLIVREAEFRNMVVPLTDEFTAHPGCGVSARVRATVLGPWAIDETVATPPHQQHRTVMVGNQRLLESEGIAIPESILDRLEEFDAAGQTVLLVAVDDEVLGVIGVRDTVRAESREVIRSLREAGIEHFALLTGDRDPSAQTVSKELGLVDVEAEMLPIDKANWIEARIKQGRRVAMVGDGVNDAPALATANVGIALGGVGSDIAAEAGDLVLMGDPLRPLPGLLRLSRQLVLNIRQSIYIFAFGMNGLGMLLCAWGILSPTGGAVFHEFASIAVMLNAMRLLWFERWEDTRLGRLSGLLGQAAQWLTETFSPAQLIYRFLNSWTVLVRLAAASLLLYWFVSGVVLLSPGEQALVTRFGRYHETLDAGWHWRWPVPLEQVYRERTEHIRTVQLGFRASGPVQAADDFAPAPVEWTSEHDDERYQAVTPESLVLVADEIPIELTAEVHYRIADLYQYLYGGAATEDTLRAAAESSIRQVAAQETLDGILTDRRQQIESACLDSVRRMIADYGLGVEITDLHLLDIHPPKAVVPAYRDAANALEERERAVNDGETYYARRLLSAAGENAIRLLTDSAKTQRSRQEATTGGLADWTLDDAELWNQLLARQLLSGEAAAKLLAAEEAGLRKTEAAHGAAARYQALLDVYRADTYLTGLHLYWSTIEKTLGSRPLTILDPKVAGRQHLMLIDPFETGNLKNLPPFTPIDDAPMIMPQREEDH